MHTTNIELYCETMKCLKHLVDSTVTIIQSLEETKRKKAEITDSKLSSNQLELINEESIKIPIHLNVESISFKLLNTFISKINSKTVLFYQPTLIQKPYQLHLSPIFRLDFYDLIVFFAHLFLMKSRFFRKNVEKAILPRNSSLTCHNLQLNLQSESLRDSFSIQLGNLISSNQPDKLVELSLKSDSIKIDRLRSLHSISDKKPDNLMSNLQVVNRCNPSKKIKNSDSFLVPDILEKITHAIQTTQPIAPKAEEIEATQPFEFVPFTQSFDCSHLCFPQTQFNLGEIQSSQIISFRKCNTIHFNEDENDLKNLNNTLSSIKNMEDGGEEEHMTLIDDKISSKQFIQFVPIQPNEPANQPDQVVPIIFTQCGTRIDCSTVVLKTPKLDTTSSQLETRSNEENQDNERIKALKRRLFMRLGLSKRQKIRKHLHSNFD